MEQRIESKSASIKAIDGTTVHKICSGQVVLNLSGVIKELVENSLDAGATSIEIRLKMYGKDLIEVSDNGTGVEESNFRALTLKHYTSKISDFADLVTVDTFGFRGEALSSLCALSDLIVITCHEASSIGTKLEFDHNGSLVKRSPVPRQKGTTVSLQNIFSTLPVRHKEFTRNLKKDFGKMVQLLYAYCIISEGVRITCTNQTESGKKSVVVSTNGNHHIKENIVNIFGPKQISSLMEWEQHQPSTETLTEFSLPEDYSSKNNFRICGFISRCIHGEGRSSTDRQFFFINQRPCDLNKVSKIINEIYHTYNRNQYPFIMLDITLEKNAVDINVTPDKRLLFVDNEKLLLAVIKESLLKMYEKFPASCPVESSPIFMNSKKDNSKISQRNPISEDSKRGSLLARFKRSFSQLDNEKSIKETTSKGKQRKIDNFIRKEFSTDTIKSMASSLKPISSIPTKQASEESKLFENHQPDINENLYHCEEECDVKTLDVSSGKSSILEESDIVTTDVDRNVELNIDRDEISLNNKLVEKDVPNELKHVSSLENNDKAILDLKITSTDDILKAKVAERKYTFNETGNISSEENFVMDTSERVNKKTVNLSWSLEQLKNAVKQKAVKKQEEFTRNFRAKINPSDNKAAEEELQKVLSQDMFLKMEILGQFNLGFIITKLDDDLFIVDQHATDEKYNFEQLQNTKVLQSQKLIQPQVLELPVVSENVVIDNLHIFKKNSFEIQIDEDALPMQKIKLISIPISYGWCCDKKDVEELIFMLSDSPGIMCRPSRVSRMFASRACHKSVMIGNSLNRAEMKRLVQHMGEIEQPWNCPHGRPTIRHLVNLKMLATD